MDEMKTKQPRKKNVKKKVSEIKVENELPKDNNEIREIIVEKSIGFNTIEVVLISIIVLVFGIIVGVAVTYTTKFQNPLTSSSEKSEIEKVYDSILENYNGSIDKNILADSAIKGMLSSLEDPYSSYITTESTEKFDEQIYGYYIGIGVEITRNEENNVIITKVFESSPALEAEISTGDLITKVDGKSITEMSIDDIGNLVKGNENTIVNITINHDGQEKDIELTRKRIDTISVYSNIIEKDEKKVGYITIETFAANTYDQFKTQLNMLTEEKIDSLIINLRDNLGGQLDSAKKIASLFLPKDKVVYQLVTKGIKESVYSLQYGSFDKPVSVLVNGSSASASEILACALKESYGATIVGTKTYGKGKIQDSYKLSSGATIKYSTQEWLTPNGNSINEVGLAPDIEVGFSETYQGTIETDNQITTAVNDIITK